MQDTEPFLKSLAFCMEKAGFGNSSSSSFRRMCEVPKAETIPENPHDLHKNSPTADGTVPASEHFNGSVKNGKGSMVSEVPKKQMIVTANVT